MRAKILIVSILTILMAACNKDQFTTKPQLTFESFSTDVVPAPGQLEITLSYTDKEGDIRDTIYVERRAVNCNTDTLRAFYPLPSNLPKVKNSEGKIVITYSHAPDFTFPDIGEPTCGTAADTCIYRFALSDEAGNTSDTITSPPLIIIKR